MEQTPREYAIELVNEFKGYVYCYLGSGMLTNTYNEGVALLNAKKCAAIAIKRTIYYANTFGDVVLQDIQYFETALKELETL